MTKTCVLLAEPADILARSTASLVVAEIDTRACGSNSCQISAYLVIIVLSSLNDSAGPYEFDVRRFWGCKADSVVEVGN